ncbi:hypothetical protein Q8A67_021977 [Cirrhinus molitorella]|uniref:Uncharacterized protein n=1 Tax=Cirrhinus molitorella TaxID=172907 RepID=A0AA88TCF4_9TELE|nr:hypothetical protein Q8A67_021977 [Cirrhinus molitorella]
MKPGEKAEDADAVITCRYCADRQPGLAVRNSIGYICHPLYLEALSKRWEKKNIKAIGLRVECPRDCDPGPSVALSLPDVSIMEVSTPRPSILSSECTGAARTALLRPVHQPPHSPCLSGLASSPLALLNEIEIYQPSSRAASSVYADASRREACLLGDRSPPASSSPRLKSFISIPLI